MILVVEDDMCVADTLCIVIGTFNLKCETVYTINEALKKIRSKFYSTVLLDMLFPDGRADPIIEEIQANYPHTKIVLMSAMNTRDINVVAEKYNISNILLKPFQLETLEKFIC